jgi:hypothetical protein
MPDIRLAQCGIRQKAKALARLLQIYNAHKKNAGPKGPAS